MVYIHTDKNASLAQDVLKRSLRIQSICQILTKTKADISRYPNKLRDPTATDDNQKQMWHY